MSKIVYGSHLARRLKERKIPQDYPKLVYQKTNRVFVDTQSGHYVRVAQLKYAEKLRQITIVYDKIKAKIEIITIFPISETELANKIKSGRWTKRIKK